MSLSGLIGLLYRRGELFQCSDYFRAYGAVELYMNGAVFKSVKPGGYNGCALARGFDGIHWRILIADTEPAPQQERGGFSFSDLHVKAQPALRYVTQVNLERASDRISNRSFRLLWIDGQFYK